MAYGPQFLSEVPFTENIVKSTQKLCFLRKGMKKIKSFPFVS